MYRCLLRGRIIEGTKVTEELVALKKLYALQALKGYDNFRPNTKIPIMEPSMSIFLYVQVDEGTRKKDVNANASKLAEIQIYGGAILLKTTLYRLEDLSPRDVESTKKLIEEKGRACNGCGRATKLLSCSRCKFTRYYSKRCQRTA